MTEFVLTLSHAARANSGLESLGVYFEHAVELNDFSAAQKDDALRAALEMTLRQAVQGAMSMAERKKKPFGKEDAAALCYKVLEEIREDKRGFYTAQVPEGKIVLTAPQADEFTRIVVNAKRGNGAWEAMPESERGRWVASMQAHILGYGKHLKDNEKAVVWGNLGTDNEADFFALRYKHVVTARTRCPTNAPQADAGLLAL